MLSYSATKLDMTSPANFGRHLSVFEKWPKMPPPMFLSQILVAWHFAWSIQLVSFLFSQQIVMFIEYGGLGLDYSYAVAINEEFGGINCGAVPMSIGVQTDMATPALARYLSPSFIETSCGHCFSVH